VREKQKIHAETTLGKTVQVRNYLFSPLDLPPVSSVMLLRW